MLKSVASFAMRVYRSSATLAALDSPSYEGSGSIGSAWYPPTYFCVTVATVA